ncbi:MAG: hypothetical protein ABIH42_08935, partial [Planctomycetota bacterium]
IQTSDMYYYLIKGYEAISNCFTDNGELVVTNDTTKSLENALLFYRAGYPSLSLEILQQSFEILEKKGELPPTDNVIAKVKESLKDPQIPDIQKEETISRLCVFLKKYF